MKVDLIASVYVLNYLRIWKNSALISLVLKQGHHQELIAIRLIIQKQKLNEAMIFIKASPMIQQSLSLSKYIVGLEIQMKLHNKLLMTILLNRLCILEWNEGLDPVIVHL